MKTIALLATGGTIASAPTKDGLVPALTGAELVRLSGVETICRVTSRDVFALDSSNIQPEEWRILAEAVREALNTCDGAVVTHGTDTMAYSAAALSYMLCGHEKPIIFTGAQLPITHPLSDAIPNIHCAFAAAATGVAGTYVAFHQKIISGVRAEKTRTTSFDAFDSVNAPLSGFVDGDGVHFTNPQQFSEPYRFRDEIDPRVFLLKLMPGTMPDVFDWIVSAGYKGVVIEAFGLGGLHYIRRNLVDKLHMLAEKGLYALVVTQCLYEKADFTVYEVGSRILSTHVFSGRDMTTEAAVTKLMWALGQGEPEKYLHQNFCGEFSGN
jgi:L-asparaginase